MKNPNLKKWNKVATVLLLAAFLPGQSVFAREIFSDLKQSYNSWTRQNRQAMPKLAAEWDHYTGQFGAGGAALFAISRVTNPIITTCTGMQPGSVQTKQLAQNAVYLRPLNPWIKIMIGKDIANPYLAQIGGSNILSLDRWVFKQDPLEVASLATICVGGGYAIAAATGGASLGGLTTLQLDNLGNFGKFVQWYLKPAALISQEGLLSNTLLNIGARSAVSGILNTAGANVGSYFFTGEPLSLEQNLLIFGTAAGSNILSKAIFPMGLSEISAFQNSPLWWKPILYRAAESALTSAPSVGAVFVDFTNAAYGNINTYAARKPNTPAPDLISELFMKPYLEGAKNGLLFGAWIGPLGNISPSGGSLAKIASKIWGDSTVVSYFTLPVTSAGIRLGLAPLFGEEYLSKENIDGAFDWAISALLVRCFTVHLDKPKVNQDSLSSGRLPTAAAGKELPSEIPLPAKPKITQPITEADDLAGLKINPDSLKVDKAFDAAKLSEAFRNQKQTIGILKENFVNMISKEMFQNNNGLKLTTLATLSINPQTLFAINPSLSKELFLATNSKMFFNPQAIENIALQNSVTQAISNGLVPGNQQLPSLPEKPLPNQKILDFISQHPLFAAVKKEWPSLTKQSSSKNIANVIASRKIADPIIKNSVESGAEAGKELFLGHFVRPVTGKMVGTNLFEDSDAIQRLESSVMKPWIENLNSATIK